MISFTCKAQDTVEIKFDTLYNNLINYTPKNFSIDETSKPKNRFLELNLNSIGGLKMVYEFQIEMKLEAEDIKWLEKQIDQIALSFYLEGNPILIRKTGGYSGCEGNKIRKENINGNDVTILDFCFTCSGAGKLEDFIKIFNNRTEKLIKK